MKKKTSVATVRRMISSRQETKTSLKHAGALAVLTTSAQVINMVELKKGSDVNQRTGQRIKINKIDCRVACDASPLNSARIRIMVIRDKQADALLPLLAYDWFVDKTIANAVLSGYDPNTVGPRYQILKDRTFQLNVLGGANDRTERHEFRLLSFKKHSITFNAGNAGDVTDILTGSIYLAVYSDATVDGPSFAYTFSYTFKDA